MLTARCIDHDRNIQFEHPSDWSVSIQPPDKGRPAFLTIWSPAAPDGSPGALVAIALEWHDEGDVRRFADLRLGHEARADGYALVARSTGRHPGNGLPAVTATCDLMLNGTAQRKEFVFLKIAPNAVLSGASLCPRSSRALWREGTKKIFSTLGVIDPTRPPAPTTGDVLGAGLPPGCSEAIRLLWLLLDFTAKQLVDAHGSTLRDGAGVMLGSAARFEAQVYLLHELSLTMLGHGYPGERYQNVRNSILFAITGQAPQKVPDGALARQAERQSLYLAADGREQKPVSQNRILLFAELLTTSGTAHNPARLDPEATKMRLRDVNEAKAIVLEDHLRLTAAFRYSIARLFRDTSDIDVLSPEEVDQRFTEGHEKAAQLGLTA
jgi:hypothetical protein